MIIGTPTLFAFDISIHEEFTRGGGGLWVNAMVFVNGKCLSAEIPNRQYWLTEEVGNLELALEPLRWDRNYSLPEAISLQSGSRVLEYIYDQTYVWREDEHWPDPRISAMVTGCMMTTDCVPLEDVIIVVLPHRNGYRLIASREATYGKSVSDDFTKAAAKQWPFEVEEVILTRRYFHEMYASLIAWVDEEHVKRGLPIFPRRPAFQPEIPER